MAKVPTYEKSGTANERAANKRHLHPGDRKPRSPRKLPTSRSGRFRRPNDSQMYRGGESVRPIKRDPVEHAELLTGLMETQQYLLGTIIINGGTSPQDAFCHLCNPLTMGFSL